MNPLVRDLLRRGWPWYAYLGIHAALMGAVSASGSKVADSGFISPMFPAVLFMTTTRVQWAGLMTQWLRLPVERSVIERGLLWAYWGVPCLIVLMAMGLTPLVVSVLFESYEVSVPDLLAYALAQPILWAVAVVAFAWGDNRPVSRMRPGFHAGWSWRVAPLVLAILYVMWSWAQPSDWERWMGWRGLLLILLAPLALWTPKAMRAMLWGWDRRPGAVGEDNAVVAARRKASEFQQLSRWLKPGVRAAGPFAPIQRTLTLLAVLDVVVCWALATQFGMPGWAELGVSMLPYFLIIGPLVASVARLQNARVLHQLPRSRRWLGALAWRPLILGWAFMVLLYGFATWMGSSSFGEGTIWVAISTRIPIPALLLPVAAVLATATVLLRKCGTMLPTVVVGVVLVGFAVGPLWLARLKITPAQEWALLASSGLAIGLMRPYLHWRLRRRLPHASFFPALGGGSAGS